MEMEVWSSFLESFFSQVECFDWVNATAVIRRFTTAAYSPLCKILINLINCERLYYSMSIYTDNQVKLKIS